MLTVPRPVLHQRIARRAEEMVQRGLIEEVAVVLADGHPPAAPGLDGIGLREAVEYLHGARPRESVAEAITISTRQYAKRQETWFRHQLRCDGDRPWTPRGRRRQPRRPRSPTHGSTERRMKIGITCYPTYGGSGAVATELGLELARRGHEVHFITYASPFRLRGLRRAGLLPRGRDHGWAAIRCSSTSPTRWRWPRSSTRWRCAKKLDLLHVHYAIPHATTAWLAREMLQGERPLKVITTLHGTDITLVGQEASFYAITKFSIEQSDAVTAVSAYLRDETYRAFGCVSCDLQVIPNFVNLAEYRPDGAGAARAPGARRAQGASPTSPTSAR